MELEHKGQKYRSAHKLDARTQFHVARRLAPVVLAMAESGHSVKLVGGVPQLSDGDLGAASGMAEAISAMPDAEANFVLDKTLGVCQRLDARGGAAVWVPVMEPTTGRLMFEDLDMMDMLKLVMAVLQENLANFFQDPSGAAAGTSEGTSKV